MARTAGSFATLAVLGALATANEACKEAPSSALQAEIAAVLAQVVPGVVAPVLSEFDVRLEALGVAVAAWDAGGPREAVRPVFVETMRVWQQLEVARLGPLGSELSVVGGLSLRDEIYSWPTNNPCLVDQKTVEMGFSDPGWFEANRVPAYGLDALEHLLYAGPENACPGQLPLNAEGTWDAMGAAGIEASRAAYAVHLVEGLRSNVDAVEVALDGFALDAITHGSDQEALNAIYDATFSLETLVQDQKLAESFFARECETDCLEQVESRASSGGSTDWLVANLHGVRALFTGGDGAGLDDLLGDDGTRFLAELDAAISEAEGTSVPLDVLYDNDASDALALLDLVKTATDVLRDEVSVELALRIPVEAGGDAD